MAGAAPAGVVPLPEIGTPWGLPEALSVKANVAVRVPAEVGRNATDTPQLLPAATVTAEQVSVVFALEADPLKVPVGHFGRNASRLNVLEKSRDTCRVGCVRNCRHRSRPSSWSSGFHSAPGSSAR